MYLDNKLFHSKYICENNINFVKQVFKFSKARKFSGKTIILKKTANLNGAINIFKAIISLKRTQISDLASKKLYIKQIMAVYEEASSQVYYENFPKNTILNGTKFI